jgi:predicted thioesterase
MKVSELIKPGQSREENFLVEEEHTAYHIGSGDERVLGTPWMISFMERVSNRLVSSHLPAGMMSVGIHVDVRHLAATPVNAMVRVQVEVIEVKKSRIFLKVAAWDSTEKIGDGTHQRAVVERARFMQRVMEKA